MLLLLFACASDEVVWAVNHASVVPTESGITGTQTWEFFTKKWGKNHSETAFICARAQELTGTLSTSTKGCEGCLAAYSLTIQEIESDCEADLATDPAYATMLAFGVGDVPADYAEDDPHPGQSMGWYVSFDGSLLEPMGFVWDEAFDYAGEPGAPGWQNDQVYTFWPAAAWDLRSE